MISDLNFALVSIHQADLRREADEARLARLAIRNARPSEGLIPRSGPTRIDRAGWLPALRPNRP